MPLTASFTAQQSIGEPNKIVLTDTSAGSDGTITTRRVYVQLPNGTYLVQSGTTTDYESWDYADSSITLNLLSRSQACKVTVQWMAGSSIVYSVTNYVTFNLYDYVFALELLQNVTSSAKILSDTNFFTNYMKLIVDISNSENAVVYADDYYSAQEALDRNYVLIQNQNYYF